MTPEEQQAFTAAQSAYMSAVTYLVTTLIPVLGVMLFAVLGWALGKLPGVVR